MALKVLMTRKQSGEIKEVRGALEEETREGLSEEGPLECGWNEGRGVT